MKKKIDLVQNVFKRYQAYQLNFHVKDNIIFLKGRVHCYEEKYMIAEQIAKLKVFEHVVNEIEVDGLLNKSAKYDESIKTNEFDHLSIDVLIIGGGIIGCSILRELTRYKLNVMLVEKENDVALHQSSRNDGNIHPGVDLHKDTLKLKYLNLAREMWPQLAKELKFKYIKTGQIIAYQSDPTLFNAYVYVKSKQNKIKNIGYLDRSKLLKIEPNIGEKVMGGIIFREAGQISPYEVTIALAENAISNGAKIYLDTIVKSMEVKDHEIISVITNRGTICPKVIINAAGVFSEDIAKMADDHFFSIHPRKGSEFILDKKLLNRYSKHTVGLKRLADAKAKTKGGGFVLTVDGNYLVGPDAYEVPDKEDFSTKKESLLAILKKQQPLFKNVSTKDIITYFSGIRACTYEEDFVVQKGKWTKNIIHAAGIQSPGLTCAPSIGQEVAKLASSYFNNVEKNNNFNPNREPIVRFNELSIEDKDKLIKQNPNYGLIVCRCEKISRQEIIEALHRPLLANTIDAIKRRVRAGMGRCQGGFCCPQVLKIIAEEKNIAYLDVKKKGATSLLVKASK